MLIDPESLDLAQLSARAGVSSRTVRYYIQQGLLPSPDARGPGAHYGAEHLDRLLLIRRLQRQHLPLAEIRRRIEALDAHQVRLLLAAPASSSRNSASEYIRDALSVAAASFHDAHGLRPSLREPLPDEPESRKPKSLSARSQWERLILAPDVELHVRRPLSREQNRQVERLAEAARHIFREET